MMIRKMLGVVFQTRTRVVVRNNRSTAGARVLLAIEGRLAEAQKESELRQEKAQKSRKEDLAAAQKESELRQEKAQKSFKVDLAEAQKSMEEFIVARETTLIIGVLVATCTGAVMAVSLFYWGGGEIISPWNNAKAKQSGQR